MVNYIYLINWFWEDVPYRAGYKSEYGTLFLAIVDSVNRNGWRSTRIEYDRIINKTRIGKRMYYEAIKWLQSEELLTYKAGRNEYAAAEFNLSEQLKAEVQKCASTTPLLHLSDTAASPSTTPIIDKPLNSETNKQNTPGSGEPLTAPTEVKPNKPVKPFTYPDEFDAFWIGSEKPTASKKSAYLEWQKLKPEERATATAKLVTYKAWQPEARFRQDPERYLKRRTYENDFAAGLKQQQTAPVATFTKTGSVGREIT